MRTCFHVTKIQETNSAKREVKISTQKLRVTPWKDLKPPLFDHQVPDPLTAKGRNGKVHQQQSKKQD